MKKIPFSPPDITEEEIAEVVDTLRSGWITTGPKTKRFEAMISEYCGVEKTICLNSATAGLELVLRLFDIGPGDEVITTPYTFAATANVIIHTGATPVFVDVKPDQFNIDPDAIARAITHKTKAVIPVDFAGFPCDYKEIYTILNDKKHVYHPTTGTLQESIDRPLVLIDAAHSFGSSYNGKKSGNLGDFSVFSFHAVKNLTTSEGGAITFNAIGDTTSDELYKKLQLLSLHGQSKDAFTKMKAGGWFYDIAIAGYKYNMTDIAASLGIVQLKRFNDMQIIRKSIYEKYISLLSNDSRIILPDFNAEDKVYSYHLMPIRIKNADEKMRSSIIEFAAKKDIALNVHFIPVTMHPAYTNLGYSINSTPNAYNSYHNEITLPLYSTMTLDDVDCVVSVLHDALESILN